MMRAKLANSTVNYNRNLTILREKVSQDLYLRNSIYNINNRKPHYGINQNMYMIYTVKKKPGKNQGAGSRGGSKAGSRAGSIQGSRQGSRPGSKAGSNQGSRPGSRYGSPTSKRTLNTFSYYQTQPNRSQNSKVIYKYKLRKDDYLQGLERQKLERQNFINLENQRMKNRIKRLSSPYSQQRLRKDSIKNSKNYSLTCRENYQT